MNVLSATVNLDPLFQFTSNNLDGSGMHGQSSVGRLYGKTVSELATKIANSQGFYIWGRYESTRLWRTIYLGKAGFGKTASLRARITEELKDERAFVWCGDHTGLQREDCKRIWQRYYPPISSSQAPENHINRALRKSGTTHIVWVSISDMDNNNVRLVEADLIETMNPIANFHRPAPTSDLQQITVEVIRAMKAEIHRHRMQVNGNRLCAL